MKLIKDFGVRALLGAIAGLGFYGSLIFVFAKYDLDLPTIIALIGLANTPWLMSLTFYFGFRLGQTKSGGE